MEALNPGKDGSHGSAADVQRGAEGSGHADRAGRPQDPATNRGASSGRLSGWAFVLRRCGRESGRPRSMVVRASTTTEDAIRIAALVGARQVRRANEILRT